ncbi:hypothetical protein [Deinococcus sp. QL22]|uniref:hypothetical protein n=1 Tax=Deinococcus sp. QL22 TaxID=2939437 RepID=UPI002016BA57|nr:hypothetical protein [Deinococcus sp. QL22]UQN08820.1 hypothetical protein M1R55_19640 [Deinococcus sp. QL22]
MISTHVLRRCCTKDLNETQRQTLSDALSHDSEIGSFVFAAMKYVAVARSLRKTKFSLFEHRYFRMFKENETLIPTATECLQGLVDTTVTLRTVRPRLLHTQPALHGSVDVDIALKLFQN